MIQADLVRRYILSKLNGLRVYISCLSPTEKEALERLHGQEGVETMARIADHIMQELGHAPTDFDKRKRKRDNPNIIAARSFESLPLDEVPQKAKAK